MVANARRLIDVDSNALRLGLAPGVSLADARARFPMLIAIDADPPEEAKLIGRIADDCQRFTPLVALDSPDSLMLDVSGVAHLFGGEEGLLAEAARRFARQGLSLSQGLADNPAAAYALARHGRLAIASAGLSGKAFQRLFHDMPLAALGIEPRVAADMARAGLRRIGDAAMRPRAPIAARFGARVIERLDALHGLARDAISPRFAPPAFIAERRFASPLQRVEGVAGTVLKLADDLVTLLARQAKGARKLELCLFRVDGIMRRIRVGASRPVNDPADIARLFKERLASGEEDDIDAGFGIDLIRLSCLVAEPLGDGQSDFDRALDVERARALSRLLDSLSARLGPSRVTRPVLLDAHLPEQAAAETPALRAPEPSAILVPAQEAPTRPLRLFERPEPIETLAEVPDGPPLRFIWRRVIHDVAAIEGPERLSAPWWRAADMPTRDYFRAEDREGRRFWLYREGLWGVETVRAKWFMHGTFG